ncbi:MAG: hypothetical protein COC01_07355 [Bacteroidetes bacterium]|nr:MAG: hypothetical protein COC01_07355 [Bacteroidota bacterium]
MKLIFYWTTAWNSTIGFFTIEKSIDGVNFETIIKVKVEKENKRYNSVDEMPSSGTSYYRIKQIDTNGSYFYSSVIKVNILN